MFKHHGWRIVSINQALTGKVFMMRDESSFAFPYQAA